MDAKIEVTSKKSSSCPLGYEELVAVNGREGLSYLWGRG